MRGIREYVDLLILVSLAVVFNFFFRCWEVGKAIKSNISKLLSNFKGGDEK